MDSVRCRARTASAPAEAWVAWWANISDHEVTIGGWACGSRLGEGRKDGDESRSEGFHSDDRWACLVGRLFSCRGLEDLLLVDVNKERQAKEECSVLFL